MLTETTYLLLFLLLLFFNEYTSTAQSVFIPPNNYFAICSDAFKIPVQTPVLREMISVTHFNHLLANVTQIFPITSGGQMQVWTMPAGVYYNKFTKPETKNQAISESYQNGSCGNLVENCFVNITLDDSSDTCLVISSNLPKDILTASFTLSFTVEHRNGGNVLDRLSELQIILITTAASFGLLLMTVVPFAIYEKTRFRSEASKMKLKACLATGAQAINKSSQREDRVPLVSQPDYSDSRQSYHANRQQPGYRPGSETISSYELDDRMRDV